MARFSINFYVLTILFGILALTGSASYEEQQAPHAPESKTESSVTQSNPTCRKLTQLCTQYGDYSCCEELVCTGDLENLPGGVGVCTPIGEQPTFPTECQENLQLCQPNGPYNCCDGFNCVHPRTLPPIAGIDFDKLKLPPGIGICAAV